MLSVAFFLTFIGFVSLLVLWCTREREALDNSEFFDLSLDTRRYTSIDMIVGRDVEISFWMYLERERMERGQKVNWKEDGF